MRSRNGWYAGASHSTAYDLASPWHQSAAGVPVCEVASGPRSPRQPFVRTSQTVGVPERPLLLVERNCLATDTLCHARRGTTLIVSRESKSPAKLREG